MSALTVLPVVGGVILLLVVLVQFFRLRAFRFKKQAEFHQGRAGQEAALRRNRSSLDAELEALGNRHNLEELNEEEDLAERGDFNNHWSADGVRGNERSGADGDGFAASRASGVADD